MSLAERFWAKVNEDGPIPEAFPELGPCWLWTVGKTRGGYGAFSIGRTMARAHRVAFELVYGKLPPSVMVDHKCHVHACVRPEHLRKVTRKQNAEHRKGVPSDNTSGVMGVSWVSHRSKWRARVVHEGKTHYLGHYTDLKEAEEIVIAKRNELFTHNDLDRV